MSVIPIIKKFKTEGQVRFIVGKGGVGIQLNEDDALYIAQTLALFLGCRVLKTVGAELEFIKADANKNSTKEYPLGGELIEDDLFNAGYKELS